MHCIVPVAESFWGSIILVRRVPAHMSVSNMNDTQKKSKKRSSATPEKEFLWQTIVTKNSEIFLITSKSKPDRSVYNLWMKTETSWKKIASGKNPLDLEDKYVK